MTMLDTAGRIAGVVDVHSHVLFGVDDGATDLAASLAMLRVAAAEGIATMVATPHTCDGRYDVPRALARERLAALRAAAAAEGIAVDVRLAGEVRLHESVPDLVASEPDVSLDGRGRYLLLELPHETVPPSLPQLIFALKSRRTTPVIAHPERNIAVRAAPEMVAEWIRLGAKTQVTAGSIAGAFGAGIRAVATRLLCAGWTHVLATDCHAPARRPPCVQDAMAAATALAGEAAAHALLVDNPARIVAGEHPDAIEPPAVVRPRRRFFSFLMRS